MKENNNTEGSQVWDKGTIPRITSLPLLGFNKLSSEDGSLLGQLSKREMGKLLYDLAKVHYDKSDMNLAEKNFLESLKYAERPRDNFAMMKTYGFLIRIASERLENEKADTYISKVNELIDELGKKLGTLNAEYFYNVGILNNYLGNFNEAKENFLLTYRKSKEENEPEILAKCLFSLATNRFHEKDYDLALEYLYQLDELLQIINKTYLSGSMYLLRGRINIELGRYDKALTFLSKATKNLQEKKSWNLVGYILLGRGTVYQSMGEFDNALMFYELALESIDKDNFKRLTRLIHEEIQEVNDSSVDIYLDRTNRKVREKTIGTIDFKHRFVLLEILFLLAKNPGVSYDKEYLAKSIWKDEYNPLIHDKLIYTSISRLRKLIEPKNNRGEKRKYILRGKDGYTFNSLAKIRFHMENKLGLGESIANVELSSPV